MNKNIEIIQPDDWHVHFREGDMLEMVTNFSSRINKRCVAMPNTEIPITDTNKASAYKELLNKACLLYTSPSPRDGLLSRMPSSA